MPDEINTPPNTVSYAKSAYANEILRERSRREQFEPTAKDFTDPRFDRIWNVIKRWEVPYGGELRSGATGNDVVEILRALDAMPDESRTLYESGDCCMARHANAVPPWTCDCPCHTMPDESRPEDECANCDGGFDELSHNSPCPLANFLEALNMRDAANKRAEAAEAKIAEQDAEIAHWRREATTTASYVLRDALLTRAEQAESALAQAYARIAQLEAALNLIASWSEGDTVTGRFDELA